VRTQPQQVAAVEAEEAEQLAATGTDGARPTGPPRPAGPRLAGPPRPALAATGPSASQSSESWGKVGRNAPCPCGSGKKYKHCHGRLQ
jgi:preprotein translocase subunit SecA